MLHKPIKFFNLKINSMKTLVSILVACVLFGCSSDDDDSPKPAVSIAVDFEFSVKGTDGSDLLNPDNPNGLDQSKIKLFYKVDGEEEEVFDGNLDNPRHFFIYKEKENDDYRIRVFLNHTIAEDQPVTYIQWNNEETDTVRAKFYHSSASTTIEKVWLNGEAIFPTAENKKLYYQMTK